MKVVKNFLLLQASNENTIIAKGPCSLWRHGSRALVWP